MAPSSRQLVKDWIQYLKNNQVIKLKPDLKSGRLSYKRNPTTSDLLKFLDLETDFDQAFVKKTIRTVLGKKTGAPSSSSTDLADPAAAGSTTSDVSTWRDSEMSPGDPEQGSYRAPLPPPDKPKKYSNDDAEDIEFKDPSADNREPQGPPALSGPKRKPRFKYRNKPVTEAFYDRPGDELDEDDIREIFKILATTKPPKPAEAPAADSEKKSKEIATLKTLIRDKMDPAQRRALWQSLKESSLTESEMSKSDINAVFTSASNMGIRPSLYGRTFKGLEKKDVSVNDLQQSWADGVDGVAYPTDSRDIEYILSQHGFGKKEIDKVFSKVLDMEDTDVPASAAIRKIADYAKKTGIDASLVAFLEREFADDLNMKESVRHLVIEEIRDIFTAIAVEERTDRARMLDSYNQSQLGRGKK